MIDIDSTPSNDQSFSDYQGKTNDDILKSVESIFSEAISAGKCYIVPEYQRGYKWDRNNAIKLLEDLKNFEDGNALDHNSFYCLQNITIIPHKDNNGWNVVDGQQRLTTLYILLSYLKYQNKVHKQDDNNLDFFSNPSCLDYKIRGEGTGKFLKESVFSGKIWEESIQPGKAGQRPQKKDQWYIIDVAEGISWWFKNNKLKTDTVTKRLKLIVNNMRSPAVSEEEIFAGLNGGKVDLDGSDLVRAELITRSAKEKYTNDLAPKIKEFRIRIALELDEMNLWWGQKEQRTFFEQFLTDDLLKVSSFNHNLHPISLLYKLYYLVYKTDNKRFGIEFFENGKNFNDIRQDDHWELYESIMAMHRTLHTWFTDSLLYHWIGYLIFRFKKETSFLDIWNLWQVSTGKDDFLSKVIDKIKYELNTGYNGKLIENIRNVSFQWYGNNSQSLPNILILMDIMKCTGLYNDEASKKDKANNNILKISSMKGGTIRLPAEYFSKKDEDFEHIRSCAPNPEEGKEVREKKEWIEHINRNYSDVVEGGDEDKMKKELLKILYNTDSEILSDSTIDSLNIKMNEYGQHSIGNLVLLDSGVNKSYKNAMFQEKIQRVFSEFMGNKKYIRPHTMIVFEHKISGQDRLWRWTQEDIKTNAKNIATNVELFMSISL